jgi:glutaredoxin 3
MAKVTLYTATYCPYCNAAKNLLNDKNIPFEVIDVTDDKDFGDLIEKTGMQTVPQIFINEELIGGFDDLRRLDSEGELDKKLAS